MIDPDLNFKKVIPASNLKNFNSELLNNFDFERKHKNERELNDINKIVTNKEYENGFFLKEIEILKQKAKVTLKEKIELQNQLAEECVVSDKLKQEFLEQENALLIQLGVLKAEKSEYKKKVLKLEKELQKIDISIFQKKYNFNTQLKSKSNDIKELNEEILKLKSLNNQCNQKLMEQNQKLDQVIKENIELKQINSKLMEDSETYNLSIEESIYTHLNDITVPSKKMSELVKSTEAINVLIEDEEDLKLKNEMLADQVEALTTYVSKILSKVCKDERLEKALTNCIFEDE
ncbi:hypothetical protein HK099_002231, partial [Clydaea vesicula]